MRSGQSTIALVALSLLILVVLVFALRSRQRRAQRDAAAGALWVAMVFAGCWARRALIAEHDNGCYPRAAAQPARSRHALRRQAAAAFIFMAVAEVAAVVLMVLFFNLDFDASHGAAGS